MADQVSDEGPSPIRGHVSVVGVVGGEVFGRKAMTAVDQASMVVGSGRHRQALGLGPSVRSIDLKGPLDPILGAVVEAARAGERVCVLASGDPGFFGIVRVLAARFDDPTDLQVYPAPSSIALAFARLGTNWDDAVVVSAHGRPLEPAVEACLRGPKTAVLTSPDNPPQRLGAVLVERGCSPRRVSVLSRLGEDDEQVVHTDLPGLAAGTFDPLSVVVVRHPADAATDTATATGAEADPGTNSAKQSGRAAAHALVVPPGVRWGQPEDAFEHRSGMITKAEVRAISLSKLGPPPRGVLWDVGTGSGSVAVEAASLSPRLTVYAIDRDPAALDLVRENASRHGVTVHTVEGAAPAVLADLPDPDAVFVGGGGLDVVDAALARLRPGGRVVANFVLIDRAVEAHARLGAMCQVAVSRGQRLGEAGLMLRPENPIFICWGPTAGVSR